MGVTKARPREPTYEAPPRSRAVPGSDAPMDLTPALRPYTMAAVRPLHNRPVEGHPAPMISESGRRTALVRLDSRTRRSRLEGACTAATRRCGRTGKYTAVVTTTVAH